MRLRLPFISAVFALLPATALAQEPVNQEDAPAPADEPAEADEGTDSAEPAAAEAKAEASVSLGAATASTEGNAQAETEVTATRSVATRSGPEKAGSSEWKFDYHGYFRAPMRVGMGKRDVQPGFEVEGASDTTLHAPIIPDDQFLSFQSSPHNKRDWAELFITIGNSWASGTVSIQGYNFAEAAWNEVDAQFGISQGYVTITPDLGYENFRLALKAGAFSDKYGQAGRYDAGEYDTYLFGRTHNAGYSLHIDFDLDESNTLYFEQGIGAKRPDPNHYNDARFTMLGHVHAGLRQGRDLELGAHYMHAWTQEEDRFQAPSGESRTGLPDGKMWVAGVEARAELGAFGYIYAGFSHIEGKYAVTVAPIIEVLHAQGGGQFQLGITDNYFNAPGCASVSVMSPPLPMGAPPTWGLRKDGCSDGNGSINAISAQYEFSLTNFTQQIDGGQRFWGDGEDLRLILYGLYAMVSSESYDTTTEAGIAGATPGYDVNKLKFGADLNWQALSWLHPGIRFDRIQPNSHIPEQSFAILSPRLTFKSQFLTRETISLQYSRYFYSRRECNPNGTMDPLPFRCVQPPPAPVLYEGFGSFPDGQDSGNRATGGNPPARPHIPDVNVFKIEASMWW
jgi:hypothetical protein